jgi:hypothetical protein
MWFLVLVVAIELMLLASVVAGCGGSYVGPTSPTAAAPAPADTCGHHEDHK